MDMVKGHSMSRGLWLAAAVVLAMLFVGHADVLPAYGQIGWLTGRNAQVNSFVTAMAVMIIPGAFLAALPARLKSGDKSEQPSGRSLLMAFLGGILLVLGFGVAGGGMTAGLLFGGLAAWAFLAVAWIVGGLLIRTWGGDRA